MAVSEPTEVFEEFVSRRGAGRLRADGQPIIYLEKAIDGIKHMYPTDSEHVSPKPVNIDSGPNKYRST